MWSCARRSENKLELQPVGIGEEDRIIGRAIARIIGRRVEDRRADAAQQIVQRVDILAALRRPGQVVKPWRIAIVLPPGACAPRSEEHTSEPQSLMRISYAVFCLKKKIREQTTKAS